VDASVDIAGNLGSDRSGCSPKRQLPQIFEIKVFAATDFAERAE